MNTAAEVTADQNNLKRPEVDMAGSCFVWNAPYRMMSIGTTTPAQTYQMPLAQKSSNLGPFRTGKTAFWPFCCLSMAHLRTGVNGAAAAY